MHGAKEWIVSADGCRSAWACFCLAVLLLTTGCGGPEAQVEASANAPEPDMRASTGPSEPAEPEAAPRVANGAEEPAPPSEPDEVAPAAKPDAGETQAAATGTDKATGTDGAAGTDEAPDALVYHDEPPPEFDALERELIAKWDSLRSLSARIETVNDVVQGKVTQRRRAHGTFDMSRRDGKTRVRVEMNSGRLENDEGEVTGLVYTILGISDGESIYFLRDFMGTKEAYKMPIDRGLMIELGGKLVFDRMRAVNYIAIPPREKLDGREVIVFAGKQRTGEQTAKYYFDPEYGAMVKSVVDDPVAHTKQVMDVIDIVTGVDFNEDYFDFVLPEGVELKLPPEPPTPEAEP